MAKTALYPVPQKTKRYSDSKIENKEILLRNQTVFNKIMNGEIVGFLTAFDSSLNHPFF
jgi:hypothetical protein